MNKWTLKEVVINKTRPAILTILLTLALTKLINQIFTREVVLENGFIHTTNFFLSGPAMLLLAIPVSFISVLLMKLFMNMGGKQATPVEHRLEFTWYSIYGIVIGLLAFFTLSTGLNTFVASVAVDTLGGGFLWTSIALFVPAGVAIAFAIILNRVMIRITNTNSRLILEIEQGQHEHYFKDFDSKEHVIKALRKGHTSTITGAIWYVRGAKFLRRTVVAIMKAFGALAVLLWKLTPTINRAGSSGGSYQPVRSTSMSQSELDQKNKKEKSQAEFEARQKQKQANYSQKKFVDQFNYNAKYSRPEWNRYVHDQRKANEAQERADRM